MIIISQLRLNDVDSSNPKNKTSTDFVCSPPAAASIRTLLMMQIFSTSDFHSGRSQQSARRNSTTSRKSRRNPRQLRNRESLPYRSKSTRREQTVVHPSTSNQIFCPLRSLCSVHHARMGAAAAGYLTILRDSPL